MAWSTFSLAIVTAFLAWSAHRQISLMAEDQRPWVGFEIINAPVAKPGEAMNALIAVKNAGKAPALNVRAQFRVDRWDTKDRLGECLDACSKSFLLPGDSVRYPTGIPANMTDYTGTAPAILGRVDYADAHGNHYWTTMCRYYEKQYSALSACGEGDDAGPH
jgi:hypothetical protein